MREREQDLAAVDLAVAVVTFDAGPLAAAYVRQTNLPWPLLIDRDRTLYHAYGMHRGRPWDLYGPRSIWAYLKLLAKGRRPRRPGSDVAQLGGDVLIDPSGIVRVHHVGSGPADRPAVDELLAVVRGEQARRTT